MLRSVVSKVAWVGRTVSMVFGLALVLALVFGAATIALGANGSTFVLGTINNTATALTKLTANVQGPAMQVQNTNPGTDDNALSLSVQPGEAPMRVNSTSRVVNLNVDKIDGKDSSELLPGGVLPSGTTLRGSYEIDGRASAANELVGGDAISFLYTLPATPQEVFVRSGATPPPQCPGTYLSPEAQAGYLCVYEQGANNIAAPAASGLPYNVSTVGANLYGRFVIAGEAYTYGRWAVTSS